MGWSHLAFRWPSRRATQWCGAITARATGGSSMPREDSRGGLPARDGRPGSKSGTQTQVLIVDDYAIVRAGLRAILEADNHIQVVAEADTVSAAARLSARTRPDVAVMAVLPGRRIGTQAISEIQATCPDTQVLVLTPPGDNEALFASI